MGIRAVIFDFNGVLVDDESVHFALFREVLAQERVIITERDYHERYLGYDDRGCFEAALADAGQSARRELVDRLIAQKACRYVEVAAQGLRFFPHAAETLTTIAARWPVAICSGALRPEIEYALGRMGRLGQIIAIISAEDTPKGKPDPEGYRLAWTALSTHMDKNRHDLSSAQQKTTIRLEPFQCLVIEDSLAGIVSAKQAGMQAVGVPNTYTADQLREAGADDVIERLDSLTPMWIERRFGR
jgi:beta-phosphoglucomutase-like phosphatase (HAD superfamily)